MNGPEFAHAHFGIESVLWIRASEILRLNENKLFVPGSTTKLLTEGTRSSNFWAQTTAFTLGSMDGQARLSEALLDGDIVLVASGDPDLSGRIQADDTLGFEDEDHSYGRPGQ